MDSIEEYVRRVKAGEVDCFEPIVETYKKQIYLYCCRMLGCKQDAQDPSRISSSKRLPSFIPMKLKFHSHHGYTRLDIIIVSIFFVSDGFACE